MTVVEEYKSIDNAISGAREITDPDRLEQRIFLLVFQRQAIESEEAALAEALRSTVVGGEYTSAMIERWTNLEAIRVRMVTETRLLEARRAEIAKR